MASVATVVSVNLDAPASMQKQVHELQAMLDVARKGVSKRMEKLLEPKAISQVVHSLAGEVYSVQLRAAEVLSYLARCCCGERLAEQLWESCLEDRVELCVYYCIRKGEYDACCCVMEALARVLQHGRYLQLCWAAPDGRRRNLTCLLRGLLDLFVHLAVEFNHITFFRKAWLAARLNEALLLLAQRVAAFPWPLQYAVHLLQASNSAILNGNKELNCLAMTVLSFIVKYSGGELLYGIKSTGVLNSIISALTMKGGGGGSASGGSGGGACAGGGGISGGGRGSGSSSGSGGGGTAGQLPHPESVPGIGGPGAQAGAAGGDSGTPRGGGTPGMQGAMHGGLQGGMPGSAQGHIQGSLQGSSSTQPAGGQVAGSSGRGAAVGHSGAHPHPASGHSTASTGSRGVSTSTHGTGTSGGGQAASSVGRGVGDSDRAAGSAGNQGATTAGGGPEGGGGSSGNGASDPGLGSSGRPAAGGPAAGAGVVVGPVVAGGLGAGLAGLPGLSSLRGLSIPGLGLGWLGPMGVPVPGVSMGMPAMGLSIPPATSMGFSMPPATMGLSIPPATLGLSMPPTTMGLGMPPATTMGFSMPAAAMGLSVAPTTMGVPAWGMGLDLDSSGVVCVPGLMDMAGLPMPVLPMLPMLPAAAAVAYHMAASHG